MSGEFPQVGPYRLQSELGKGGMGTVYLALDPAGHQVAVKVINPELSQHEQFRMRFRREADSARRVRRFCTAAVLDAALDGNQLYVVTEYVPGPSLAVSVERYGPMRGSSLDALAVGVATALTSIHAAGVVHRDLKPANVLLSPLGPRVIDFGIARALDTLDGVTATGELIGTPRYMAPEVLRGEPISAACDVFSWGCLVAYAASGRAPFGGDTLPSIIYQVLNAEPVLDDVEPGLRELVAAALHKDPLRRPTAQQLLDQMVGRSAAPEQAAQTVQAAWSQTGQWQPPTTPAAPAQRGPGQGGPGQGGSGRRGRLLAGLAVAAAVMVAGGVGLWAALSPSGPPTDLSLLFQDDFTDKSGGWTGTYDPDGTASYGYMNDATYGIDVDESNEQRWAQAPIPFVPAQPPTPEPSATPTPNTPSTLLIGADVTLRSSRGSGEYGLYCRGGEGSVSAAYEFVLDTAGNARIRRVSNGAGGNLAKPVKVDALTPKTKTRLDVSCAEVSPGTVRLTMWVNGSMVHEVEDPNALASGNVGMFARVPEDGTSALKTVFDDFDLRGALPKKP